MLYSFLLNKSRLAQVLALVALVAGAPALAETPE